MYRKATALSAIALVAALSACSAEPGQNADGQPKDGNPEVKPVANASALVTKTTAAIEAANTVTMRMKVSGTPEAAKKFNMQCQMNLGKSTFACDGPTEIVMLSEAVYVKRTSGMGTKPPSDKKPWMKVPSELTKMFEVLTERILKFSDFKATIPPGSKITSSKQAEINGEQAVRYEVTVDVEAMLTHRMEMLTKTLPGDQAKVKKKLDELRPKVKANLSEMHYSIWVGSDHLPIQVKAGVPTPGSAEATAGTITVTYTGWGEPVDIAAPPADKVFSPDLPSLPKTQQPN